MNMKIRPILHQMIAIDILAIEFQLDLNESEHNLVD